MVLKRFFSSLFILIIIFLIPSCGNRSNEYVLEGNSIGNLEGDGLVASDGSNLYFVETQGNTSYLFKSKLNLKKKTKISDSIGFCLNIKDNKIFYIDTQNKVCVMNTDGTENEIIFAHNVNFIYVYKDRLYAIVSPNNADELWSQRKYNLISMSLTGDDIKILTDKPVWKIYIEDDQIYYVYYTDSPRVGHFQRMGLNGENDVNIKDITDNVSNFSVLDNYLYYSCDVGIIKKCDLQSGECKEIKASQTTSTENLINFNQNLVVYLGLDYLHHIVDLEEESEIEAVRLLKDSNILINGVRHITSVYFVGDTLYYYVEGELNMKKIL